MLALAAIPATAPRVQNATGVDPASILRGLTPKQQQILQQLGIPGTEAGNDNRATQRAEESEQIRHRATREAEEQNPFGIPLVKTADYLIVEVDSQPLPPRPPDTGALLQALNCAAGGAAAG